MPSISAGKLRKRIAIQRVTDSRDTMGGVTETWETVESVWCEIAPVTGGSGEHFETDALESEIAAMIRMRETALTNKDRLVSPDGRIWNIATVLEPKKPGGYMVAMVKEPTTESG